MIRKIKKAKETCYKRTIRFLDVLCRRQLINNKPQKLEKVKKQNKFPKKMKNKNLQMKKKQELNLPQHKSQKKLKPYPNTVHNKLIIKSTKNNNNKKNKTKGTRVILHSNKLTRALIKR